MGIVTFVMNEMELEEPVNICGIEEGSLLEIPHMPGVVRGCCRRCCIAEDVAPYPRAKTLNSHRLRLRDCLALLAANGITIRTFVVTRT